MTWPYKFSVGELMKRATHREVADTQTTNNGKGVLPSSRKTNSDEARKGVGKPAPFPKCCMDKDNLPEDFRMCIDCPRKKPLDAGMNTC